ncbi:MAG: amidophosphoribosyltransferase [Myxococcota bacterium]
MCGIFGISGHVEAAKLAYLGLHALQHRGQESAGIVVSKNGGQQTQRHAGEGLVADVFDLENLERLAGDRAIGHVRYSTAGGSDIRNVQPMIAETGAGPIAIAHNGNLVNADTMRRALEAEGAIFASRSDTEIILHLLARARAQRFQDRVRAALAQVTGAYSLLLLHQEMIIGLRDPSGFRPMVLGKLGDAFVLASETGALDLIEATYVRDVEPGEMVIIDKSGLRSERLYHAPEEKPRACIFELVYFARPDGKVFGSDVYNARFQMGQRLAKETPVEADLVIPVPDSGVPAALGYADASGLPFRHGLLRSHYVGRTFIEPSQQIRNFGVKLKLSAVRSVLEGKRVVVVDDSLVRGTTSRKIVKMIREAGAKEVHLRISAPPTKFPCFYGIDTPTKKELIASEQSLAEIQQFVTADSLGYLSLEGLHAAVQDQAGEQRRFCNACFTGGYSVPVA